MKLDTLVLALALPALVAMPAGAQTPDFSGTWQLDRDASDIPERGAGPRGGRGGGPGRRGGGPGGPGGFGGPAATLVVTQSADLLTIEQQMPPREPFGELPPRRRREHERRPAAAIW